MIPFLISKRNIFLKLIGTYGLTTLRMDTGERIQLSKQILQSQKTHAIASYKNYCDETDFESLCSRKLFDILNSLKSGTTKNCSWTGRLCRRRCRSMTLYVRYVGSCTPWSSLTVSIFQI